MFACALFFPLTAAANAAVIALDRLVVAALPRLRRGR
jgi:hypothetical protein